MSSLEGALLTAEHPSRGPENYSNASFHAEDTATDNVEMEPFHQEFQPKHHAQEPDTDEDAEMTDLFGNDNEQLKPQENGSSPAASIVESDRLPSPERKHREALEYGEDDDEPGGIVEEVKEADVAFPNIPVPKSSDGDVRVFFVKYGFINNSNKHQNWVIRMPNYVKVDSKPFHRDTYLGPEHEDEEADHPQSSGEKSMTIKLKVENTVRWRWTKDQIGTDQRQSNSRIIRWSDGSLSLRLGKELFDINQSIDTSGAVPRRSIGPQSSQSQSQTPLTQSTPSGAKSQGLTYLVAQHKRAQVLQSEALITGYMTLQPAGMQSETHRMLVRAVGQKHNKVARLRIAPDPTVDPEREVFELQKQSAKKSKRKADQDDGYGSGRRRRTGYARKRSSHDMWSDDEDEDVQHQYAELDEDDEEMSGSPRKGKRKHPGEHEEKKGGDYQEDDFVVADSSEDEAGARKMRRNREADDETEEDPLDKLDAQIMEQEDAKKKRQKRANGPLAEQEDDEEEKDDAEMDVESEEEEEESKVRRTAGGSRKKRALPLDDDDPDD